MHGILRFLPLAALCLHAGAGSPALAQTSEAELKAAFIFTLSKYIEWPNDRLPDGAPLRVCFTSANSPLATALQPLTGKSIRGHSLELLTSQSAAAIPNCHVLINPSVKQASHPGVLTLADREGFVEEGGHIELVMDNNRVNFSANLSAARQAGLQPSAQLLKLARQVR